MKSAIAIGTIALALVLGDFPAAIAKPANAKVEKLLKDEEHLNGLCRGGSGDDPKTERACALRDKLFDKLTREGWCYGHENAFGYQKYWAECGTHPDPTVAEAPAEPAKKQWFTADINFSSCRQSSRSPADRIRMIQEYGKRAEINDLADGVVEVGEEIGGGKTSFVVFYPTQAACTAALPRSKPVDRRYE